jgi:hypothetical protein
MIDKIKSNLTSHYLMFVFDFADPSTVNAKELSAFIGCPIVEMFKSQRTADRSKKTLGRSGFGKALVCYFNSFSTHDGIDFKRLERELTENKKVFLRHLGKDKVNYLTLLISVAEAIEPKRRGLLAV